MSLFDYIKESDKKAENKRTQDIIIANKWEERAIKAVDDCFDAVLGISKKEIDRIVLNNKPHSFEVVIVVRAPQQDEPSKEGYPFSNAIANWSQDSLWGLRQNNGDVGIHVCNRKEQEYCAMRIEEKLIKEGFSINKKRAKFRTSSSYIVITAMMSW